MLAAGVPRAKTCICCREMEVVGPAGTGAEVNAVGLMTDSRGSTALTHTHTYTHIYIQYDYLSRSDMENTTSKQ